MRLELIPSWASSLIDHVRLYNLLLAMHRFFTFPLDFRKKYSTDLCHELAEHGIYYHDGRLRCRFCKFSISGEELPECFSRQTTEAEEKVRKRHEEKACRIHAADSKNVPMGRVDSSVLNFKFEAHRLFSLLRKLDWQHVSPYDLARSGFYYTGNKDNVRCAFCNLEVHGWEEGDTPDGEHRRWNPKCPFLHNGKSVNNIPIESEKNKGRKNAGANPFSEPRRLQKYGKFICSVRRSDPCLLTARDLSIQEWCDPLNPNFATTASRIASYAEFWPRSIGQSPRELAKAGFFYTGNGDRVTCFQCDLPLMNWHPEDVPFVRHCIMNPDCQFLKMCKGPNFESLIDLQMMYSNLVSRDGFSEWDRLHGLETGMPGALQDAESPSRLASNPPANGGDMCCTKCKNRDASKVSLPCGHMTLCSDCTDQNCAVCDGVIISEIKLVSVHQ